MGKRKGIVRDAFEGWRQQSSGQAVLAAEAIHAAGGVHDLLLARVERVRVAGHFHFDQGIGFAIGPLDGFLGSDGGPGEEREIGGNILKHDFAVGWMNIFLHECRNLRNTVSRSAAPGWRVGINAWAGR